MAPRSDFTNRVIKEQMALKVVSNKDFAPIVGLSLSGLYTRFNDKRSWKIEEIAKAAEFFGVPVSTFFAPSVEQVRA